MIRPRKLGVIAHGRMDQSRIAGTIFTRHSHMQGAQSVMPEYRPEDMVFEMEEEKIPVYNPPKPGDEADEDDDGAAAGMEQGENGARDCALHMYLLYRTTLQRLHHACLLGNQIVPSKGLTRGCARSTPGGEHVMGSAVCSTVSLAPQLHR